MSAKPTWKLIVADVMAGLAQMQDESVHCVVTSPLEPETESLL